MYTINSKPNHVSSSLNACSECGDEVSKLVEDVSEGLPRISRQTVSIGALDTGCRIPENPVCLETGKVNQPVAPQSCNAESDPVNSPDKSLDKVTIYHNPRCSKSRQTLALIEDAGVSPTVVKYLETPASRDTLAEWIARSGQPASAFLRPSEKQAKALGITAKSDPDAILDAIAQYPALMERPVVVTEKGVILGRPPENVKNVL